MTVVTYQRDYLFSKIINGKAVLSELGQIADVCWHTIPDHFPFVELGAHVIMPNHVHGIITIVGATQWVASTRTATRPTGPKRGSLGAIIGSYKMVVTRRSGREYNATGIWQHNYYACPEPVEGTISSATNAR